jgi:hypothetical protein
MAPGRVREYLVDSMDVQSDVHDLKDMDGEIANGTSTGEANSRSISEPIKQVCQIRR